MENIAQLLQDAKDCRYYTSALQGEIEGGGNIANCVKFADALAETSDRLCKVFKALESATKERKGT